MKYRLLSLLAFAGVLFSSCVKENFPAEGGSILAVMENDDTRTSVTDEGVFTWSEGDKVWLHTTLEGVVGTLSSGAGTASANFSYGSYFGEMTDRAVYPYNEGHSISGDVLSVVMPASYDLGSALTNTNAAMYGLLSDGRLRFNHMAGVMRFKFNNVPAGVNKFTITLDKKISGTFTADLTEAFPVIETSDDAAEAEKTITLNFNALTETSDIALYVPLPLGTYNSLELALYAGTKSVWTYSKSVTNTIARKSLKLMPAVTLGGTIGGDIEGGESEKEPLLLTYEVTSAGIPINLARDAENYPVAGEDNALNYIDYGDGTRGIEYSHVYAEPGVYNVKMFFEDDVTQIGQSAFENCEELIGVDLPKGLKLIGDHAFCCSGLGGTLIIPSNSIVLGGYAFLGTGQYDFIHIPSGTTFEGVGHFSDIVVNKLYLGANIPYYLSVSTLSYFWGALIDELEIGNQVSYLGDYALSHAKIKTLTFERNSILTDLGDGVFALNSELETITLPSVERIGKFAFDRCPKLEAINIDSSLSAKNSLNFFSSDGILYTLIDYTKAVFRYPEAKKGDTFEDVGITALASSAFRENTYLKKIKLGFTDSIGDYAFMGCTNLTQLESCDYPYSAVGSCFVGSDAFRNCSSLPEFTIAATVDTIKTSAFYGCHKLKSIYCKPVTPPILQDDYEDMPVFGANALGRLIYVPKESVDAYRSAPGWSNYKDYIVADDYVDAMFNSDLSENGTSNCYIVSSAASYKFTPTKGNSNESVGAIASAEVLWETFGTDVTPNVGDLVANVKYEDGVIRFETPATYKEGNAVIAAKDADGNILWSWHIWLTDQPQGQVYYNDAGTMMDRNLGATSATPGDVGALGLLYQWGRKDPFLGSSSISSSTLAKSTITWPSTVSSNSSNDTISYATAHPTTFITYNGSNYDWYYTGDSSADNTRWSTSDKTKSIYDPCPQGWRVPDGGYNGVWSTALDSSSYFEDDSLYSSTNGGMNFSGKFGSASTIWYPASGYRHFNDGSLNNVGGSGCYWSASPYSNYAYNLVFDLFGSVSPSDYIGRAYGYSVRCVRESE